MHEMSLVRALLNQVAELARGQRAAAVREVRIEIGPLSGVEPLLVHSAFEQLAPASMAAGARLVIDEVPLVARCRDCGAQFEPRRFRFRCSVCGSGRAAVEAGDAVMLVSIGIAQAEPAAAGCETNTGQEKVVRT